MINAIKDSVYNDYTYMTKHNFGQRIKPAFYCLRIYKKGVLINNFGNNNIQLFKHENATFSYKTNKVKNISMQCDISFEVSIFKRFGIFYLQYSLTCILF